MVRIFGSMGVMPLIGMAAFLGSAYLCGASMDERSKILGERNQLGASVLEKAAGEDHLLDTNEKIQLARSLGCTGLLDETLPLSYNFTTLNNTYEPFKITNGCQSCEPSDEAMRKYLQ